MKAALKAGWRRARTALSLGATVLAIASLWTGFAWAIEQGQLFATQEDGFARLVLTFPGLEHPPEYTLTLENGVFSLLFTEPVDVVMPDVDKTLPDYVSVARVDTDGRGLRFGLRAALKFNRVEAGEEVYIDLLPPDWQGPPPPLPPDVLARIAERERLAALRAEEVRKQQEFDRLHPKVDVRVGSNPTFLRLQFDWTVNTKAEFSQTDQEGVLSFEWPVDLDLSALKANLPAEIVAVGTDLSSGGATVKLTLAAGVKPRFYQESARSFILDIDLGHADIPELTAADLTEQVTGADHVSATENTGAHQSEPATSEVAAAHPSTVPEVITPFISTLGSTLRVVFPFEQDTPSAVFRRGNSIWMMFDTTTGIAVPTDKAALGPVVSAFSVVASGDTQVVQIDLSQDRLATLGSEGRAWVLSLGDILLTPTEPVTLSRRRDNEGLFEMTADIDRPARIHKFVDPIVGDTLEVVTAFPPSRGVLRSLEYVDFYALRSVHGLVIQPKHEGVDVAIESKLAVITARGGLTVSALDRQRAVGAGLTEDSRTAFIDLVSLEQKDPAEFVKHRDQLMMDTANASGRDLDVARLSLAQYYLANGFAYEALGVLRVLESQLAAKDIIRKIRVTTAIAATLASRPTDALPILVSPSLTDEADALFWRAIARADSGDFIGAKIDGLAAEQVSEAYPAWAQNRFRFAILRAAVETGDIAVAVRVLEEIDFARLTIEETSLYHLLSGRIAELQGHIADAIDTYGQVVAADVRPTRAEAIYRTLVLLDGQGNLDLDKAVVTLAAESLLWRGNTLEAAMQKLLAEFYFRQGDYRSGFETVKQAVANYSESKEINALRDEAQTMFIELFLNGLADSLGPVEALSLYYDFRQLTPPGARGDEMIRNLARRLVKVDLLAQAAELLEYQLTNRLKGAAQAQVAADLAVIYLADRRPQDAQRVLNATRMPDISTTLTRQRRVLEARAMIDGGRDELALDVLNDMQGRDTDLLRIDAHWRAKRYAVAGELLEAMYSDAVSIGALSQPARMDVIKAGVAYVLAGEDLSLSRLRSKFAEAMVTSPEWPMFDYVTGTISVDSLEFKKVARAVSGIDSLNAFLTSYRETYGTEGALAPITASKQDQTLASK